MLKLFFALLNVFYEADCQWWNDEVEQLQMLGVLLFCDAFEVVHDHSEVVSSIVGLLEEVLDAQVKDLYCFHCLSSDS